jgi:hypothetical protein
MSQTWVGPLLCVFVQILEALPQDVLITCRAFSEALAALEHHTMVRVTTAWTRIILHICESNATQGHDVAFSPP